MRVIQLRSFAAKYYPTVEKTVKKSGVPLFPEAEVMQSFNSRMIDPTKTQHKSIDDIRRDRARRLTQRVLRHQRHLQEIGREVKGIKRIAAKHVKRHR
jgi:hypothetical protein